MRRFLLSVNSSRRSRFEIFVEAMAACLSIAVPKRRSSKNCLARGYADDTACVRTPPESHNRTNS